MTHTWRRRLLGAAVVLIVVIGIVLVISGGDDAPTAPSTTTTSLAPGATPAATLPLSDTSIAGIAALAGLAVPDDVADFLTASTEDRTQLDVTFTLPPDEVDTFITGSGFPTLGEDRVITHSSPLWKVNPSGEVRGAADESGSVRRAVETVPETAPESGGGAGGARVRVRLVVTPAG